MTTSESAGVPVQEPTAEIPRQQPTAEVPRQQPTAEVPRQQSAAEADAADRELAPQPAEKEVTADKRETAPLTGRVVAPPNDPKALQAEIERTREQLGETVQELASRVDVKKRARAKAAELSGRMKTSTVQARQNAVARVGNVRGQVTNRTAATRQRAASGGAGGREQLRNRAAAVGTPVWQATPEPVRRVVTKGANGARERWMPIAAAAGVLIVGYLAVSQLRKRSAARDRTVTTVRANEPGSSRQSSKRSAARDRTVVTIRTSEPDSSREDC